MAARAIATIGAVLVIGAVVLRGGRVETVDALSVEGEVRSVTGEKIVVKTSDGTREIARADVVEIRFAPVAEAMGKTGRGVLVTAAGDRLTVSGLALSGGVLRFDNPLLGRAKLDMKSASMILEPNPRLTPSEVLARVRELKLPDVAKDILIVAQRADLWLKVGGVLKSIEDESIGFHWKDADQSVDRKLVRAVRLAAVVTEKHAPPVGRLVGRDGSTLAFSSVSLDAGTLSASVPCLGEVEVPVKSVALIRFSSGRVTHLTDLKPAKASEHGFFEKTFRHRAHRAVSGGALRLGGRTYRIGLGLHSACELTYELGGAYTKFTALAGIDDAVRPLGDATLTFLGDGKALCDPLRLTGKDAPRTVRLTNLEGVKSFTVRVGFGPDKLDVADHVDLVEPRLIK